MPVEALDPLNRLVALQANLGKFFKLVLIIQHLLIRLILVTILAQRKVSLGLVVQGLATVSAQREAFSRV
jgi:hypothetical protein